MHVCMKCMCVCIAVVDDAVQEVDRVAAPPAVVRPSAQAEDSRSGFQHFYLAES